MAVQLTGTNRLQRRLVAVPDFNGVYCVTGWFKLPSLPAAANTPAAVFGIGPNAGFNDDSEWFDVMNNGAVRVRVKPGSSETVSQPSAAGVVTANTWIPFAFYRESATSLKLTIGATTVTNTQDVTSRTNATHFQIGAAPTTGDRIASLSGEVASFKIWEGAIPSDFGVESQYRNPQDELGNVWAVYHIIDTSTFATDASGNSRPLSALTTDYANASDPAGILGDDPTPTGEPLLVFNTQPSNVARGEAIDPPIVVNVTSDGETVDTDFDGDVTLAIKTGDGRLVGTDTVAAVAGVASFDDIIIVQGSGTHTLEASATYDEDPLATESASFNVSQGTGGAVLPLGAPYMSTILQNQADAELRTVKFRVRNLDGSFNNSLTGKADISINSAAPVASENDMTALGDGEYSLVLDQTNEANLPVGTTLLIDAPLSSSYVSVPALVQIIPADSFDATLTEEEIAEAVAAESQTNPFHAVVQSVDEDAVTEIQNGLATSAEVGDLPTLTEIIAGEIAALDGLSNGETTVTINGVSFTVTRTARDAIDTMTAG